MSAVDRCTYCGIRFAPGAKFCSECGRSVLPPTTKPTLSEENGGTIAMAGMFIGGGFGVLLVIGAFIDPNFEGRVYIIGTPLWLGVLGFMAGFGIEKVIRRVRKKF